MNSKARSLLGGQLTIRIGKNKVHLRWAGQEHSYVFRIYFQFPRATILECVQYRYDCWNDAQRDSFCTTQSIRVPELVNFFFDRLAYYIYSVEQLWSKFPAPFRVCDMFHSSNMHYMTAVFAMYEEPLYVAANQFVTCYADWFLPGHVVLDCRLSYHIRLLGGWLQGKMTELRQICQSKNITSTSNSSISCTPECRPPAHSRHCRVTESSTFTHFPRSKSPRSHKHHCKSSSGSYHQRWCMSSSFYRKERRCVHGGCCPAPTLRFHHRHSTSTRTALRFHHRHSTSTRTASYRPYVRCHHSSCHHSSCHRSSCHPSHHRSSYRQVYSGDPTRCYATPTWRRKWRRRMISKGPSRSITFQSHTPVYPHRIVLDPWRPTIITHSDDPNTIQPMTPKGQIVPTPKMSQTDKSVDSLQMNNEIWQYVRQLQLRIERLEQSAIGEHSGVF